MTTIATLDAVAAVLKRIAQQYIALVAEEAAAMLLGPARIAVLLPSARHAPCGPWPQDAGAAPSLIRLPSAYRHRKIPADPLSPRIDDAIDVALVARNEYC